MKHTPLNCSGVLPKGPPGPMPVPAADVPAVIEEETSFSEEEKEEIEEILPAPKKQKV